MSAQGTTLGNRAVHLPVRTVITVILAALTATIGLMVFEGVRSDHVVTSTDTTGNVVPAQAHPTGLARGGLAPLVSAAAIENSFAAVREQGAFAYHAAGRAHEVVVGETPTMASGISGLENPGAYQTAPKRSAAWGERLLWLKLRRR
jgi:hypothetical protein